MKGTFWIGLILGAAGGMYILDTNAKAKQFVKQSKKKMKNADEE